jgi:hypothetical protein
VRIQHPIVVVIVVVNCVLFGIIDAEIVDFHQLPARQGADLPGPRSTQDVDQHPD